MADWVRVKDKDTKHEYSVKVVTDAHEKLNKPAVDRNGKPLPAKPHVIVSARKSAPAPDAKATKAAAKTEANKEAN